MNSQHFSQARYILRQLFHKHASSKSQFHHVVRMASSAKRKNEADSAGTKKPSMPWQQGLKAAMEDPSVRVAGDDECVMIKDKYPKARFHYLVLPHRQIHNLKSLKPDDISLLQHMHEMALDLVKEKDTGLDFRYGYHGIPSMSHVHLHVISQDFDSPSLKTKKHWNSFTTDYFIDSDQVIEMLDEEGAVNVNISELDSLLKNDLRCHQCDREFKTIPALKAHLPAHIPKDAKKS